MNILKHIAFLILILIAGYAKAQSLPTDPETKKITYQEAITLEGISKSDLFERAKNWMTETYKTNKFDLENATEGKVQHEGYFTIMLTYDFKYKTEYDVLYNLTMQVKDGKYRYIITDFKIYNSKNGRKTAEGLEGYYAKARTSNKPEIVNQVTAELNKLTTELKTAMETGKQKDKSDW